MRFSCYLPDVTLCASSCVPRTKPAAGWLLYDGTCGLCSHWVLRWAATLRKHGFETAPLQDPWVRSRLGLTESELLEDVRLLLPNGAQLAGADVYRHILRRVPWTYPVAVLASAPILRRVWDWAYRRIADNRHRMSRACRLKPQSPGKLQQVGGARRGRDLES